MSDQNTPPGGNQSWGDQSGSSQGGAQNPYASPPPGQQGPPQEYGSYQTAQQSSGGSGLAITALVLGILSIIGGFFLIGGYLLGIPAIIVGAIASSKAKKGKADGRGMAIAGIVTGVIGLLISIAFTIVAVFAFQAADFGSLQECAQQAGGDDQALAECERQFQENLEEQFGG